MDLSAFGIGFGCGLIANSMIIGVYFASKVNPDTIAKIRGAKNIAPIALALLMAGIFLVGQTAVTLAQTPVPLEIPTDVIFTEANNWIATFAPIAAIGIGIMIALAVLGYIGKMIASAFRA